MDGMGDTHILLFMDDTVIFATSRDKLQEKLNRLKNSTDSLQYDNTSSPSLQRTLWPDGHLPWADIFPMYELRF